MKVFTYLTLLLAILSCSAYAATDLSKPVTLNNNRAEIQFKGNIVESPCLIEIGNGNHINLGQIKKAARSISAPVPFNIKLSNCITDASAQGTLSIQIASGEWDSYWYGIESNYNPPDWKFRTSQQGIYAVIKTNRHLFVGVGANPTNEVIRKGTAFDLSKYVDWRTIGNDQSANILLWAQMVANVPSAVQPGPVYTVVRLSFTYN